jgi:hypothetical protein
MVVSFWSYPTILKVCCYVCMLLLVLLFWWIWSCFWPKSIDFDFCRPVVIVVLIVSAFFNHDASCLQLSPFIWMFLVMQLLLVMDSWLSEDVSVFWFVYFDSIIVDGVSNCCCRSALPLLRFIVVTLFIHLALLLYSTMGLLLFTKWAAALFSLLLL